MQHTAPTPRYLPDIAVRPPARSPALSFSDLWQAIRAVTKRLQHGQMTSVLMRLSNAELARIGVTRAQIPAYARRLVYDDATQYDSTAPAPRTGDPR